MKVFYNEVEDQLIEERGVVKKSGGILKYGQVYTVVRQRSLFYTVAIPNKLPNKNEYEEITCGKDHFLTERQMRKLKLEKLNNVQDW